MSQKEVKLEETLLLIWQLPEPEQEKLMRILEREPTAGRNQTAKTGKADLQPKRQLSELKGLGKALWQKIDAEKYLDEERDSWEI